jgi:hypothetical protein
MVTSPRVPAQTKYSGHILSRNNPVHGNNKPLVRASQTANIHFGPFYSGSEVPLCQKLFMANVRFTIHNVILIRHC